MHYIEHLSNGKLAKQVFSHDNRHNLTGNSYNTIIYIVNK